MGIQFVAIVVVLMTILDSVQATPTVRRLSRYSRYWDQATAVDDWIDSLSDYKLSYFQDMIEKGYADALIDTFAAQHDEYGDYYGNYYADSPSPPATGGASKLKEHNVGTPPKKDPPLPDHKPAASSGPVELKDKAGASPPEKHSPPGAAPHHARMGYRDYYSKPAKNRRTFRY